MGTHLDGMAAGAVAASALRRRLLAKPGAHQRQSQSVLTQTRRPLQQPGMTTLGQQAATLRGDPGRFNVAGTHGLLPTMMASQPLRTTAWVICCHTAWRLAWASMRTKR